MGSLGPTPVILSRPKRCALIVFDYDFSLVNDDSDALFCKALCPELLHRLDTPTHTAPSQGWPALMDELIGEFFQKNPNTTRDDIVRALAAIPVFPEMLDAVRLATEQYDATVAIISDANTVFIKSMLEHHKLNDGITEIHTNTGRWEGNRLRVEPYYALDQEPHGCALCPANMCKGKSFLTLEVPVYEFLTGVFDDYV
jgi:pyridoxal phosphate phosphatase PHOSPHO2